MKKLALILTSIVLTATTAGCALGATAGSVFGGSYFLRSEEVASVGNIDETTEYNVTFTPNANCPVAFSLNSGKYTMHAYTSSTESGVRCYRLDTELKINGSYTIGEAVTPVDDSIVTTALFYDVDKALKPISSSRTVKSHSVGYSEGKFTINYYDYEVSTAYDESANEAVVTFAPNLETSTGKYSLEAGTTTYSKVFEKTYLDNETILFAIRAFKLTQDFSTTFTSIDATAKVKRTLSLVSRTVTDEAGNAVSATYETLHLEYVNTGEKITGADSYKLSLSVSGTYTGSEIILYYARSDIKKNGQCLVKMQTKLQLDIGAVVQENQSSAGTFTYELINVNAR